MTAVATHALDTRAEQAAQSRAIAAHAEILNLSGGGTGGDGWADVIPLAVFNDGRSAFTLLSADIRQPGLRIDPAAPKAQAVAPGGVVQEALGYTEECPALLSPDCRMSSCASGIRAERYRR